MNDISRNTAPFDLASMLIEPRRLVLPNPWAGHIPFASWLIRQLRPRVFVELGTHTGNSYCAFCQAIDETPGAPTKAYAVDTWQGDPHAGLYDDSIYQQLRAYHDPLYGGFSTLLRKTFDEALVDFAPGSVDLLHIDGLHTYEAVRHDFETWLPKLSHRAVVLFHDTCVRRDDFGVHRLWDEVCQRFPGFNFTHSNGLGVLLVGQDRSPALVELVDQGVNPQWDQARALFSRLGAAFELRLTSEFLSDRCAHLTQAIDERDAQSLVLYRTIDERDAQTRELHEQMGELHAQTRELHAQMGELHAQMSQKLAAQHARNHELQAALAQTQAVADRQDRRAAELDAALQGVLSSHSWRITRPLRGARRVAGRVLALVRGSRPANALRLAQRQLKQHGLSGFLRRVPYYLRQLRQRPGLLAAAQAHAPQFLPAAGMRHEVRLHPELLVQAPQHPGVTVSVVIPTLNAGAEFPWLLQKLQGQQGIGGVEIVVVDSGSRDGTVAVAREAGCVVVEILPSEFSHSYARNRGADEATGDYLLFMVQDAYPIGDHWMAGILQFLQDHAHEKLVAASCAEYSRSDSDVMYDSMIHTHYQFLGCLHYDRIGELKDGGHAALRSEGQLSDVSCMIDRATFQRYRYRGDYAEDLDLGIRLIQDGYRVAMLASVKVIHSHNRPAYYYLKRSFVDVIFLVNLFPDFDYAHIESQSGLFAGVLSTAVHLSRWLQTPLPPEGSDTGGMLRRFSDEGRRQFARLDLDGPIGLGDVRLDAWLQTLRERQDAAGLLQRKLTGKEAAEAQRFLDAFLSRIDHFAHFVGLTYGLCADALCTELRQAVVKAYAAAAGSALAFMFLDMERKRCEGDFAQAQSLYSDLKAGV